MAKKQDAKVAEQVEQSESTRGRPEGAENRDYDIVDAEKTKCRRCGSTERTKYGPNPETFTREFSDSVVTTIWRRCQCAECGQWRKDRYQVTKKIKSQRD